MAVMTSLAPELDLEAARRRLATAATEARRLEEQNARFAVFDAWDRYQLIASAIKAEERRRRVAERVTDAPQ